MNGQLPLVNPGGANYAAQNQNQQLFVIGGDPGDLSGGCAMFGMPISCSEASHYLESGLGQVNGIGMTPYGAARARENPGSQKYVD